MQNFDIIKNNEIEKSYRVSRIMGDFDVKEEHISEHFKGKIEIPEKWQIGIIVGASGTGKTTIAKEIFGKKLYTPQSYIHKSVVDDMPKECSMDEIEKMFYAVGFGSVPSWLKSYHVLSNGEKMRVDMARALLENDFVVFDEFTSVVDRNVAEVASIAISNAVRNSNKKFVAVTCHYDVIEWLQPDWIFSTDTMKTSFHQAHVPKNNLSLRNVGATSGKNLGVITI